MLDIVSTKHLFILTSYSKLLYCGLRGENKRQSTVHGNLRQDAFGSKLAMLISLHFLDYVNTLIR